MPRGRKHSTPISFGELALLSRIRLRAAQGSPSELSLGIGDDCALIRPAPEEDFAVTTDLSVAGRHFRLDWHPPDSVGHRALARGLSDLAAMGSRPVAAFLSLALPPNLVQNIKSRNTHEPWSGRKTRATWIDRFLDGFFALAQTQQVPLAGGDLAESMLAVADVVLTGAVPQGRAFLRSGARPGQLIYVTGSLGAGAVGLDRLAKLAAAYERARPRPRTTDFLRIPPGLKALLTPHLYPQPRVAQGLWLMRNAIASAAIDLSDGLSTDLAHLCAESGVAAEVDAAALPFAPEATPAQALNGGEDYELLFTAPPAARVPTSIEGVPVTQIGRIVPAAEKAARKAGARSSASPITLITSKGAVPLAAQGWQHFS